MQVKDVMTKALVAVRPDSTVSEAVRAMLDHKISGVPVVDADGQLAGVLSEGDLLRRIELGTTRRAEHWYMNLFTSGGAAEAYTAAHARTVADIMTREVVTIESTAPLEDAVTLMERHRIKRLPVVDGGRLVGIVSRSDFVRALAPVVAPAYEEPATSDAEIARTVLSEIKHQTWASNSSVHVTVKDGHVTLGGTIMAEPQRDALRVLAENVNGVKSVTDQLAWIDTLGLLTV